MKIIIEKYFLVALVIIITGCSKFDVTMKDATEPETYIPRTKSDTTAVTDSLDPITFSVSVEGWKEVER